MNNAKMVSIFVSSALLVAVLVVWNQRQTLKLLRQENDQLRAELKQQQVALISPKASPGVPVSSPALNQPASVPVQAAESNDLSSDENKNAALQKMVQAITAKIQKLNKKLEQSPELNIPELQLLSENEWVKVSLDSEMATDDDLREALSKLRDKAVNTFFDEALRPAFQRYLAIHNNVMPEDIAEIRPYLKVAIDDSVFDRYELGQKGPISSDPGKALVVLKSHVDEDYHSDHNMTLNGSFGGRVNRVQGMVEEATQAFVQKHSGAIPKSPEEIAPYMMKELPRETVQKYFVKMLQLKGR